MERTFATRQIMRMVQMRGFPSTSKEAADDMIDALMTAESEEMAKAVISAFLDDATPEMPCPMASQIKKAILARLEDKYGPLRYNPICPRCDGNGFTDLGRGPRCDCWGRWPDPDYRKLKGAEPMGSELKDGLNRLVEAKRG